jgi:DNA/RNA-binding domain of Phe-tRNA-synthetase-like protein
MFAIADEVLVLKDLPGARLRRGRAGGFPPRTPHASLRIAPAALAGKLPHPHLEAWRDVYRAFGAKDGAPAVESPEPGEVIWRDDVAVTCRRWNWRQGRRTALTEATTSAVFLLEGLDVDLRPAADLLAELLSGPLAAGSVGIERLA